MFPSYGTVHFSCPSAGTGIGTGSDQLDIKVGTLAARVGSGSMYLQESDSLILGAVANVSVSSRTYSAHNTLDTVMVGTALSDVVTAAGAGNIVIQTLDGSLTASASGSLSAVGNILLQSRDELHARAN